MLGRLRGERAAFFFGLFAGTLNDVFGGQRAIGDDVPPILLRQRTEDGGAHFAGEFVRGLMRGSSVSAFPARARGGRYCSTAVQQRRAPPGLRPERSTGAA